MYKHLWLGRVILSLSFFLPIPVLAGHILAITPISPFPAEITASTITTAVYKVTNTASTISVTPVDQTAYPSGVTRLNNASTCGSLLPHGQSCIITLQLQAPSTAQTISFDLRQRASPSADGVQLPISIQVMPHTGDISIAAGLQGLSISAFVPLLASSSDRAGSFNNVALPSSIASGLMTAASCTGSGASAICAVAGVTLPGVIPYMLVSLNGGDSWELKSISGAATEMEFRSVSCAGEGSSAYCVAVGSNFLAHGSAIAVSKNGGVSWAIVTPTVPFLQITYSTVSCVGSDESSVCVAVGREFSESPYLAVLDVSTDGGLTWTSKSAQLVVADGGRLSDVHCMGSGATATCIAVGEESTGTDPFIAVSTDGAATWQIKPVGGFSGKAQLQGVSCTEDIVAPICVAAGVDTTQLLAKPFLAVSADGGVNWVYQPVGGPGLSSGSYGSASCTGAGEDAICAVVGSIPLGVNPVIVMGTDRGAVWTRKSVTLSRPGPALHAVNCKGSGASAICVAAGVSEVSNEAYFPLIVASNDGGATWTEKLVAGLNPSTNGQFLSTAGAPGDGVSSSSSVNLGSFSSQQLSVAYPKKAFGVESTIKNIFNSK